jgi:hypothetical protein
MQAVGKNSPVRLEIIRQIYIVVSSTSSDNVQ